jgi:hypothetical protein
LTTFMIRCGQFTYVYVLLERLVWRRRPHKATNSAEPILGDDT